MVSRRARRAIRSTGSGTQLRTVEDLWGSRSSTALLQDIVFPSAPAEFALRAECVVANSTST